MDGNRAAEQRALYGSTLSDRFGEVMTTYGLSQRGLAKVLGLSAPMLSQLVNAQRIKIGNPAVYERLVMLEARADEPDRARVLAEVEASQPVLSSQQSATHPTAGALAQLAASSQLTSLAAHARSIGAHALAAVLDEAAQRASQP